MNAAGWLARWEAMMASYNPTRDADHALLFALPDLDRAAELRILDLCAGPGATAHRATVAFPRATVLCVEGDGRQVALGRAAATERIAFLAADVREPGWWRQYDGAFDLVLSSTGLHWLAPADLPVLYGRVFACLRPGGWVMVSDHMADEDPAVRARHAALRQAEQDCAFAATGADRWDAFWAGVAADLRELPPSGQAALWTGDDDGHPKAYHCEALREAGFTAVAVHRQDLSEAVVGGLRPT